MDQGQPPVLACQTQTYSDRLNMLLELRLGLTRLDNEARARDARQVVTSRNWLRHSQVRLTRHATRGCAKALGPLSTSAARVMRTGGARGSNLTSICETYIEITSGCDGSTAWKGFEKFGDVSRTELNVFIGTAAMSI